MSTPSRCRLPRAQSTTGRRLPQPSTVCATSGAQTASCHHPSSTTTHSSQALGAAPSNATPIQLVGHIDAKLQSTTSDPQQPRTGSYDTTVPTPLLLSYSPLCSEVGRVASEKAASSTYAPSTTRLSLSVAASSCRTLPGSSTSEPSPWTGLAPPASRCALLPLEASQESSSPWLS